MLRLALMVRPSFFTSDASAVDSQIIEGSQNLTKYPSIGKDLLGKLSHHHFYHVVQSLTFAWQECLY